jgi:epoxyqueuosine reductase
MVSNIDLSDLTNKGCKYRVVSISHIIDLQQEINDCQQKGQFDKEFAAKYLPSFDFSLPLQLPNAQSLIVVAMPRPLTKATFT